MKILIIGEDFAEIELTKNMTARIDIQDIERVQQYKWYAQDSRTSFYACCDSAPGVYMHRFILETPENLEVNHKDGNGLNNRRFNIENCTHSANVAKQKSRRRENKLPRGVTQVRYACYAAEITINYKKIGLGYKFKSIKEASDAYDEAVLMLRGPDFPRNRWSA